MQMKPKKLLDVRFHIRNNNHSRFIVHRLVTVDEKFITLIDEFYAGCVCDFELLFALALLRRQCNVDGG
jgi:hypothetical protein